MVHRDTGQDIGLAQAPLGAAPLRLAPAVPSRLPNRSIARSVSAAWRSITNAVSVA
jgi:hypothetical protein